MYCLGCEENEVTAEQDDDVLDTLLVYDSLVSGVNFQLYCLGCEQSEVTAEQDDDFLDRLKVYALSFSVTKLSIGLSTLGCEKSEVTAEQDDDVLDTWFSSGIYPFAGRE